MDSELAEEQENKNGCIWAIFRMERDVKKCAPRIDLGSLLSIC